MKKNKRKISNHAKKFAYMIGRSEDILLIELCIKEGVWLQKEIIRHSIKNTIKAICKDNTHLLDTPEIQEIIRYFKNS